MDQSRTIGYLYILESTAVAVYIQLILKWQLRLAGQFPATLSERTQFLLRVLLNPWVISSFVAAGLGFCFWVAAISKFDLSFAYPFVVGLTVMLVLFFSSLFFREVLTFSKILGTLLILGGIFVISRG